MASALASGAASAQGMGRLCRISFNFLRSLSAASTPNATSASANPTVASSAANDSKRKKKKKKNLFEVAKFLPNWGIGYHMAKTHWANVSYEITKINLYKDGKHGKAWGIPYKDGDKPINLCNVSSGLHEKSFSTCLAKKKRKYLLKSCEYFDLDTKSPNHMIASAPPEKNSHQDKELMGGKLRQSRSLLFSVHGSYDVALFVAFFGTLHSSSKLIDLSRALFPFEVSGPPFPLPPLCFPREHWIVTPLRDS
ncbi:hypothetical protein U1Q18_015775 [Sarracenia purpurea var. burkii]